MTDHGWKQFERRICRMFGGERRGPQHRDAEAGKDDGVHTGAYSLECKLLGRPSYSDLLRAAKQAERNAPAGKIPVAIVKKNKQQDRDALVVLRLETFMDWWVR